MRCNKKANFFYSMLYCNANVNYAAIHNNYCALMKGLRYLFVRKVVWALLSRSASSTTAGARDSTCA